MRAFRVAALVILGASFVPLPPVPGAAQAGTVTVFAAASLGDAFRAMQGPFEKKNPGRQLRFNFAASSTLRVQIEQGAPADVFASADQAQIQPLVVNRRVSTPSVFARNGLVVVLPNSNPGKIRELRDLARPGLRLVGTAENVPIGRYARQVIEKLAGRKLYPREFAAKVSRNLVSREANVRAVLSKVELGEADAALVYESDARTSTRVCRLALPASANVAAEYPIAVVADSPNRAGAEAFVRFVLSNEGREILRSRGFR